MCSLEKVCAYPSISHVYTQIEFISTHFSLKQVEIMLKNTYRLERTVDSQNILLAIALEMYVRVVGMYIVDNSWPEHLWCLHWKNLWRIIIVCCVLFSVDLNNLHICWWASTFGCKHFPWKIGHQYTLTIKWCTVSCDLSLNSNYITFSKWNIGSFSMQHSRLNMIKCILQW